MGWQPLLAFSSGVVLAALLPSLPGQGAVLALLLPLIGLVFWRPTRLPALGLFGAAWFVLNAHWQLESEWPESRTGEQHRVSGQVTGLPRWRGQSLEFDFLADQSNDERWPARIQLRWYRPPGYLQPGQRWQLEVQLEPPQGRLNTGGFDRRRHLLAERVGALGRVRSGQLEARADGPAGLVNRGRQYLSEVIAAETAGLQEGALMRALSVADRSGLDAPTRELLRQTGTSHLLAISGLHVGMVAALAAFLGGLLLSPLTLLWRRLDRRRLALGLAILAALSYALLAGLSLPTQRAVLMLCVVAGAYLARRGLRPAHALLLAFAAVLLLDPLSPLATGFWLSFAAVAVLIWAFAWRSSSQTGAAAWLLGLLRAQLVIGVGLLAFNAGLFEQVSLIGLPANLIAIPLVGLWILPSLLVALALIAIDLPADWALGLAETGLELLLSYLAWLTGFEAAIAARPGAGLLAVVLAFVGSMWLLAPRGWPGRWLGLCLIAPVLWPKSAEPLQPGELRLHLFDLGSAQAVLVGTAEEWLLYDTGPGDGEGRDAIGGLLPAMLAGQSSAGLDRLVLSRPHRSSSGGLGSVLDAVSEAGRYSPSADLGRPCLAGEGWTSGAYRFEFLHPGPGLPDLGHNSSCVLRIEGPGGAVLLPGAIDAQVESRLIDAPRTVEAEVLLLSDSGHRRGSSAAWLQAVQPALALISVARSDRWGRPHPETLERLQSTEVAWQSTARCGALTVHLRPGQAPRVESARGRSLRFWNRDPDCPGAVESAWLESP
ncbi:DNA internalization-related competence protein ComEC/Rec2 [Wenzhouxiangella marina]|uniref:Uncharacterized protein n=1 Tax=Wenzhouxiangella marina TaxID=1579979 RepID=A0A0K0XWY5_9GAMM|nr:DNA internalization-related competence protein ComEC/Rec2 [Wenzhouxiangella marina]AKS42193.1 hypothetical protein WM2015_1826 [Wenzhouxiangella marina]MBB6086035.1 competence protein ComEC [Wenzhouxiangella marina]